MHLAPLIQDLAIILGIAGLMNIIFHRIQQPVVLGYIIAGFIVGPYMTSFPSVTDVNGIHIWADLGVIFLMFSLGLEFSFRKLAKVGTSAVITAGTEVIFFIPAGYAFGKWLGWTSLESAFLGAMLSISSTTIIVKALDELKLKTYRFAELIYAVLIVEDLIAILLLVGLSTFALTHTISTQDMIFSLLKLLLIVGAWMITGYFLVPKIIKYISRFANNEMLTLVSLGLCLGLVVVATYFEYSTALGAFIMGSILAETPLLHRIESRMESLRDLFGAIFFVSIGMLIDPNVLWENRTSILLLCGFTIAGKILSVTFGALLSGQSLNNSVRVGFSLAQIGEFSFIIATLGVSLKATREFIYPIIVAVSLVTTFTTPYSIRISAKIASTLENWLPSGIRGILNRYAASTQERRTRVNANRKLKLALFKWCVNALVVSIVFITGAEFLLPYMDQEFPKSLILNIIGAWFVCAILSAPFVWAMLNIARKHYTKQTAERVSAFIHIVASQLATLVLLLALSAKYFPGQYLVAIACALLILLFVLFRRRLEIFYHWYERSFLAGFHKDRTGAQANELTQFAPWDAHLVRLEIHPNSPLVLKKISEASLRGRFGVNIVAIQRGMETKVAPKPDEILLPRDEIVLLGTDQQIEKLKQELTSPPGFDADEDQTRNYELRNYPIQSKSQLIDRTIRECGIREQFNTMIVGLERSQKRILNPDSDYKLAQGDILWVVGEKKNLNTLAQKLFGIAAKK